MKYIQFSLKTFGTLVPLGMNHPYSLACAMLANVEKYSSYHGYWRGRVPRSVLFNGILNCSMNFSKIVAAFYWFHITKLH